MSQINVSQEQYDRWIKNVKKSKTNTSWIYLGDKKKKVYSWISPANMVWNIYCFVEDGDREREAHFGDIRYYIVPE
tara:strand:- start:97 stop:324 length:228 start_codon:yes stop_codon:yes gene_type:complete